MTGLNYLIIGDVLPSTDSIGELALPLPSTKPVNLGSCSQPCILESPRKLLKQSPFPISKKKKNLIDYLWPGISCFHKLLQIFKHIQLSVKKSLRNAS